MIIGIDYWKTITAHPKFFKSFVEIMQSDGHSVYLISAYNQKRSGISYKEQIKRECAEYKIDFDRIVVVGFKSDDQNPEVKLKTCLDLGVEIFFDDRPDVCELLAKNNIVTFQAHQPLTYPKI